MNTVTKQSLIAFYLEFVNNYLTISKMAEHYEMPEDDCKYLVELGEKYLTERLSKIPVEYGKENKAWSEVGYNH